MKFLFVVHETSPLCNHLNCANRVTRTRYLEQLSYEYGSIIRYEWLMIYVNLSATIGNNCNLSQFTTIGANWGRKRRPSVTMFTLVLEYAVSIVL